MCEFVAMAEDGTTPNQTIGAASTFDGDNTGRAEGEEESTVDKKTKE